FNNVYYDEDLYNSKNHDTLTKPTKQVGINQPVLGIMPLGHGLMIGEYALSDNAMKLVPKTDFTTKDTDMNYSYYVQLSYFANHKDQTVKDLSEESVKTQTFMVGVGTESNPYLIR